MLETGQELQLKKKKENIEKNKEMNIVDLPGIYSLSPYSAEEIVARNYIVEEKPDVLIKYNRCHKYRKKYVLDTSNFGNRNSNYCSIKYDG